MKTTRNASYYLRDTLTTHQLRQADALIQQVGNQPWNLLRIDHIGKKAGLLYYPRFDHRPFPRLQISYRLAGDGTLQIRRYRDATAPILHRKELLLPATDPRRTAWEALTRQAEALGLFDEPNRIGNARTWLKKLEEAGAPIAWRKNPGIPRYKTAIVRKTLSKPLQLALKRGFLTRKTTVLDYGCGRGDDVRHLEQLGIRVSGYDPHYKPATHLSPAHLVNLGYVVNVIEAPPERTRVLKNAWTLTQKVLLVSVLLGQPHARRYKDGSVSEHGTFQWFPQSNQVQRWIQSTLKARVIVLSPGIYAVLR